MFSLCAMATVYAIAAATVTGHVVDVQREPLPGASLILMTLPDSTRTAAVMAGIDGDFSFPSLSPGKYCVKASMTGMQSASRDFEVTDTTSAVALLPIQLLETSTMLQETVVTGVKAAVVARQDTLEFNAGSFHTNPNATVEDLLKKLPGVEVGSDGSIKSGGKTISKILLDGKEFFADDPQLATKNLPSDIVNKVQVIDRKSDAARLTGIDDGDDETVINLSVKKNMNNGWFGTLSGGYGTDGRYEGDLNINFFRDGNQISIIGGGNNVNQLGFGDRGRGRFRDFGGNGGITSSQRLGVNFNVGRGDDLRVGGNIFYSHSDRDARSKSETQYLFPDSVSYNSAGSKTRDKGHNIRADLRLQWNIDESNTLDFRPRFAFNRRDSHLNDSSLLRAGDLSKSLVNKTSNIRDNHGDSYETSGDLIFNHKFLSHPGRSFSFSAKYSLSDTKQHGITWSDIEYYLKSDDSESLFRFLDTHQWSNLAEGRLTWTEPIGRKDNYLTFSYKMQYRWNNADRLTYNLPFDDTSGTVAIPDLDSAPADAILSETLSNRFRNKFMTQELQIGYKRSTKTLNIDAGLLFSPSSSKSEDLINSARNIPTRYVWNVAPYARIRWKFTDQTSLMANYRARTSQPSLTQLQPVPDVSDPLNIIVGNPELKPTFTQSIMAHFNSYDMDTQRSIFAAASVSGSLNTIVSRTVTNPQTGGRSTTYANADGNWNIFGMAMLNMPLRNKAWRFNVRMNANFMSNPGYINGDFNRSSNFNLSPSAGITFSSNVFQITLNPNYSLGLATNSLPRQRDQTTHSYGFDSDASLYLPFGLQLSSDLAFSTSTGYYAGFNTTQWLWNAQLSYSTLADKSLTFSVKACDILGQKKNISRSVSAGSIIDSRHNDLTRYVMLGVTWKFNTLSKKVSRENRDFPDMPFQGPPPGALPSGAAPPAGPPPGHMHP